MQECPVCAACLEDTEPVCPQDGATLAPSIEGPPLVDGRYRLERRLSQGGMGVVYQARHLDLQRVFALKLIRSASGWEPAQLVRFRLEAETLGRLKHPGIVDVTDFGIDSRGGGLPYLVMERLQGRTLSDLCRVRGPLPIEEALPILDAVARAVDFAHEHGVLHRDLKPANVFLCDTDAGVVAKLLDFGLARLTGPRAPSVASEVHALPTGGTVPSALPGTDISDAPTLEVAHGTGSAPEPFAFAPAESLTPPGSFAGTLRYMAPECFRGQDTSVATDTYALGVTAYFVLAGRHPFEGPEQSIMDGHLRREVPRPSQVQPALAPALDAPLLKPLAKEVSRRPPSSRAFVLDLAAAARAERVRVFWREQGPRRALLAAGLAALLLTLGRAGLKLGVVRDLDRRSVDIRLRSLPARPPDPRLRLVFLDQASVDAIASPLGSPEMAAEIAERLEGVFAAGARAIAIDILPPPAWGRSERFSRFVLRHRSALTLAAYVSRGGEVFGPEALQGLTAVALGPEGLRPLFGLVNVDEDEDGIVRRARLGYSSRDGWAVPTWAAHAAHGLQGSPGGLPGAALESFWIDSSLDWRRVDRVAWRDVGARLERDPSSFAGALVFVGADLAASGDEAHRLASGDTIPGVALQAMIADTILSGFPVREAKGGFVWRAAAWLALSALAFMVLAAPRPQLVAVLGAALVLSSAAITSLLVMRWARTLVPVVVPAAQTGAIILASLLMRRGLSPHPDVLTGSR